MAKIQTVANTTEKKKWDFMAILTGVWMVAMTAIFYLFSIEKYANILNEKYGYMLIADGVLLGGFIIWALITGKPKKYWQKMKSYADDNGRWVANWFKHSFNWLDIFMLVFLIVVIPSTLFAYPYVYQAIFGNEGRWMGAITLSLLCLTFFVASRYFKYNKWYITAFLVGTLLMTLWAITDYFDMDVMGFKDGIDPDNYKIFLSSMGNIDCYAGAAAVPMAFSGIMLILSHETWYKKIFYWICFASAILSMIVCSADNAYLSIGAFFAFVPLVATRTKSGIRRYIIALATFVTAIELVKYWDIVYADTVIRTQGMIDVLSRISQLKLVAVVLWIIVVILYIYQVLIKRYTDETPANKSAYIIWLVLLIVSGVAIASLFVMVNVNASIIPEKLESLKAYLVFNDEWGSYRGCAWRFQMEAFKELPWWQKLIGAGPETSNIYLYNRNYYDVALISGFLFDSPHNEWLQMLFNNGILGLISYLGIFISPVVLASKNNLKKYFPVAMAVGFVGICHLAESFVNVTSPMDIPTIFALFALAQSLFRSEE